MLCLDYQKERVKMISTAIAIQMATQEAVTDESVMDMASALYHHRNEMTNDESLSTNS